MPLCKAFKIVSVLFCCLGLMSAPLSAQDSDAGKTPLERHGTRLLNFDTAHMLPKGALRLHIGSTQTNLNANTSGTGHQIYFGGGEYGINERVQLGFTYSHFTDPPRQPINGSNADIIFRTLSLQGKAHLFDRANFSISARASIESMLFRSPQLGIGAGNDQHVIGSFFLPTTYRASETFEFHITPGVSLFPENIAGSAFFGTVASLAGGVSWKPNRRVTGYATITAPLSGGNTITTTGSITKTTVWAVGLRYNVSPKGALDIYATNGFGATPATAILTPFGAGNETMLGVSLTYTPGRGPEYRPNYRGITASASSPRNLALQQDGFTLASADTLEPGTFLASVNGGSNNGRGVALIFAPDYDGQIEVHYADPANDGSLNAGQLPSSAASYMIGAKLRFLDQNNGSPFSLALRTLAGRDTTAGVNGTIFLDLPMSYKLANGVALMATPKFAAFGNTRSYGLGVGANVALGQNVQLLAEVTPVNNGNRTVWAGGLRYQPRQSGFYLDAMATNAVGHSGLASMTGQAATRFSLAATYRFNAAQR